MKYLVLTGLIILQLAGVSAAAKTDKQELLNRKVSLHTKLAQLEIRRNQAVHRTRVMEAEIRQLQREVRALEENVKTSEVKYELSDVRMAETQERLLKLRSKVRTREDGFTRSDEAEEALAMMDRARKYQDGLQAPVRRGENQVQVQLISSREAHGDSRRVASINRVLAQDCKVFDRPHQQGKVIGIKRAGSAVSSGGGSRSSSESWIAVTIANRKMYVQSDCF